MSMTLPPGVLPPGILPPGVPFEALRMQRPPQSGSFVAPVGLPPGMPMPMPMPMQMPVPRPMPPGAAPMAPAMPPVAAPPVAPLDPRVPLTEGVPDPSAVQRQKENYARSLEEQLRKGVEVLAATHKQQTDTLHEQANAEKQRYSSMLDQQASAYTRSILEFQVKARELELSQQYNEQLMRLQQAAQAQRAELEQQACGLTLEYQQRKVQEEYMAQQQGIQKQHMEAHQRINQEIQKHIGAIPGTGAQGLLEKVQAAMQPLATYAAPPLPMAIPVQRPASAAVLPYVPPPPGVMGPRGMRPTLSNVPPVLSAPSLSYVPPGGGMPVPAPMQMNSYVPPGGGMPVPAPMQMNSYVPPGMPMPAPMQQMNSFVPPGIPMPVPVGMQPSPSFVPPGFPMPVPAPMQPSPSYVPAVV